MPQPKLFSIIDKAIFEYQMIEEGDRILIGASGGKDSTALVEYFARRKRQGREKFDFTALHVSTEIAPPFDPGLRQLFASWGVEPVVIPVGVLERLKPGRSMNCWWCSTQRRTELNEYAMANGYNKIALGHHLDDILETLLMNALGKGELSTMPLVPQVVDAVNIPVLAAGGIGDGRGMAAAFMLGACGVQIGTCLLASEECPIHENYKQALLKAKDSDTTVTGIRTLSLDA